VSSGELKRNGDFGIGTFNALDGEMIGLDGAFYQIKVDGVAYPELPKFLNHFKMFRDLPLVPTGIYPLSPCRLLNTSPNCLLSLYYQ